MEWLRNINEDMNSELQCEKRNRNRQILTDEEVKKVRVHLGMFISRESLSTAAPVPRLPENMPCTPAEAPAASLRPHQPSRKECRKTYQANHVTIVSLPTLLSPPSLELGKHLQVRCRQRVIATATVYLARFYYNNSYKDFHPHLIAATAVYLASKVEESPVQVGAPPVVYRRA